MTAIDRATLFRDLLEIGISGVLVFVAGYLLWPPGHVYWVDVAEVVGSVVVWLVVVGLCVGFGFGVRRLAPIQPAHFATGGLLAYLVGMYLIEASTTPDSPVHRYLYGFMLVCAIFGTVARESFDFATDVFGEISGRY